MSVLAQTSGLRTLTRFRLLWRIVTRWLADLLPKGLYARARSGKLRGFTGVDAPYEPPQEPDVALRPIDRSLDDLVEQLVAALRARDIL